MNNIMKVIKFTSTQEKNSIEEAIQTKAPSQFLFEGFDKDTNSKRMYLFNINYNSNDKTYQLPGDRYLKSTDKTEFIELLKPVMGRLGFKEKSSNEEFVNQLLKEGEVINTSEGNDFDSLEEKSFDKELRSTESEYSRFTETISTLSNDDLNLLESEITELYEKNKIPKYETRKRQILNTISNLRKKRENIEMANQIVEGTIQIPKVGNPLVDRLVEKINNDWRKGVGMNSNFEGYSYNKYLEFFKNKELTKQVEVLINNVKSLLAGEKTDITSLERDKLIIDIISSLPVMDAIKHKSMFADLIGDIRSDILGDVRRESFTYVLHYGEYGYTSTNNRLIVKNRSNALEEWKSIIDPVSGFGTFATLNKHRLTSSGPDTFGNVEELFITKMALIKILDDSFNITRELQYRIKEDYKDTNEIVIDVDREKYGLGVSYSDLVDYMISKNLTMLQYYDYIVNLLNGTFSKNGKKITIV